MISEIQYMEYKRRDGMDRDSMESIREFLVYTDIAQRDMNNYLKGLHLIICGWRPFRGEYGWWMRVEQLKIVGLAVK